MKVRIVGEGGVEIQEILRDLANSFRYKSTQTDSYTLETQYLSMVGDLQDIIEWMDEEDKNEGI